MKQYIEKYFNWLFLTKRIIKLQANTPVINAPKKPMNNPSKSISLTKKAPSMSFAILPNINGITIKENRAADSLSTPKSTDVAIVAPDLETPGNIATA